MLAAAVRETGATVSLFHLPDDPAALRAELPALLTGFDLLLLSGGVSKGKADFLPAALRAAGAEEIFHEVSQRPGKPLWFGQKPGGAVVMGLPGNPVSTFVTYHRYAAPWLRAVQQPVPAPPALPFAVLATDVRFKPALTYFLLVRLESTPDGRLLAHPVYPNSSGDMTSLLPAHGFLELPAERDFFVQGEVWPLWRF
jgi:molybdopterin molybdotransferase